MTAVSRSSTSIGGIRVEYLLSNVERIKVQRWLKRIQVWRSWDSGSSLVRRATEFAAGGFTIELPGDLDAMAIHPSIPRLRFAV